MPGRADGAGAAIVAAGCVTAVGYDLATACASARAGIVRSALATDYRLAGADGAAAGEPLTAHAAEVLTHGFEGRARLLRLATAALEDLLRAPELAAVRGPVGLYLSLPQRDPERGAVELDFGGAPSDVSAVERRFAHGFTAALLEHWTLAAPAVLRFVTTAGHAGSARALRRAMHDLASGAVELAVVGAVDSLLDEETLNRLEEQGRLKSSTTPAGLQPGEGGAFLALSRGDVPGGGPSPIGRVAAVTLAEDPTPLGGDAPPAGVGVAMALADAVAAAAAAPPRPLWVLCDQNGELYRAREWGAALVRLAADAPALSEPTLWYPAMSFGDTGAASGAIAICQALQAFRRGYAPAHLAIVLSASENAARAAVALSPAQ